MDSIEPDMIEDFDLEIDPSSIHAELKVTEESRDDLSNSMLWHYAEKNPVCHVKLRNPGTATRKFELSVSGTGPLWRDGWIRWSYLVRRVRLVQGGESLAAQDEVVHEGRILRMSIGPGEERVGNLEFVPVLDGEASSGIHGFTIHAKEIVIGGKAAQKSAFGQLILGHPECWLLNHLPSIYTSERTMAEFEEPPFFERYLTGFQDVIQPIRETLARMDRLFGPFSAPEPMLVWLGAWISASVDENWTEMSKRKFLREAVKIYHWRGTRKGLSHYLKVYTGYEPDIEDQPSLASG